MLTNEHCYKIGYYDAYFMGKPETDYSGMTDEQFEMYRSGYYTGLDDYANKYIIAEEAA